MVDQLELLAVMIRQEVVVDSGIKNVGYLFIYFFIFRVLP